MSLVVDLSVAELARTRFAVSPLSETVSGLQQLGGRGRREGNPRWIRWASRELATRPLRLAYSWPLIVHERPSWPQFLVPAPAGPQTTIDDDLDAMRRTTATQVRASLRRVFGATLRGAEIPDAVAELAADPAAGLKAIADELREAHRRLIAPHWPRIRAVLDADIAYRARQLAAGGAERLFADLHPDLRWQVVTADDDRPPGSPGLWASRSSGRPEATEPPGSPGLWASRSSGRPDATGSRPDVIGRLTVCGKHGDRVVSGAAPGGLVLIPVALGSPQVLIKGHTTTQTTVRYPARGVGELWAAGARPASTSAVRLLGRHRANLLEALRSPATTTDLARALNVSPSAVSHHLRVLRDSGLVAGERTGRSVLYLTTERGLDLLEPGPTAARHTAPSDAARTNTPPTNTPPMNAPLRDTALSNTAPTAAITTA